MLWSRAARLPNPEHYIPHFSISFIQSTSVVVKVAWNINMLPHCQRILMYVSFHPWTACIIQRASLAFCFWLQLDRKFFLVHFNSQTPKVCLGDSWGLSLVFSGVTEGRNPSGLSPSSTGPCISHSVSSASFSRERGSSLKCFKKEQNLEAPASASVCEAHDRVPPAQLHPAKFPMTLWIPSTSSYLKEHRLNWLRKIEGQHTGHEGSPPPDIL